MDAASTDELVLQAQDGDEAAFAALYRAFAPRLLRYLRHEAGDPDVAEELMQRTFLRVVEALPGYQRRPGIPFAAWLFRIARNATIDERRRAHPVGIEAAALLPSRHAGPVDLAESALDRQDLLRALESLSPDQHDVLVCRFFAELSPAETARVMGRSDGSVRVLQHRAIAALRRLLSEGVQVSGLAEFDR